MSILRLLQQAQGGGGLGQLAAQLGLDPGTADQLARMLAPAIGTAARERARQGDLDRVLAPLRGESQSAMFEDARVAASPDGQAQGMAFLEQLLGGREATQSLTREAANRAGADESLVGQFLPALAAMVQGGLQQRVPDSQIDGMMQARSGGAQGAGGGLSAMIGGLPGGGKGAEGAPGLAQLLQMFDEDGDGSPLDDILGRFLR